MDFCLYAARKLAGEVGTKGLSEAQKSTLAVTFSSLSSELRKLGHDGLADRYDQLRNQFVAGKRGLVKPLGELRKALESIGSQG